MLLILGTSSGAFHLLSCDVQKREIHVQKSIEAPNPGWLCLEDANLYAAGELEGVLGKISKYERSSDGWSLSWTRQSSGEGTCHCSLARLGDEEFVLSANYVGHTIDVHDLDGNHIQTLEFNGSGPFKERQETSHCHQIIQDLQQKYIYVNDLGNDRLHRYTIQKTGHLEEQGSVHFGPAQGPRHCAFNAAHPALVYTICELSNEITIHDWSGQDAKLLQTTCILPDPATDAQKNKRYPQPASAGEIQITKGGEFLYASTRYLSKYKSDTILYAPLGKDGLVGKVTHLDTGLIAPWHLSLSPDEKYLAVVFKDSNVVELYERNAESGALNKICSIDSGFEAPGCILFYQE